MYWNIENLSADQYEFEDRKWDAKKKKWIDKKKPTQKFIDTIKPRKKHIGVEDLIIFLKELEDIQKDDYDGLKFDIKFNIKFEF